MNAVFRRGVSAAFPLPAAGAEGHIPATAHVVEGCADGGIPPAGAVFMAAPALPRALAGEPFASFRRGRGVRPGLGAPPPALLGSGFPFARV